MQKVFCPSCVTPIKINEGLPAIYCKTCGDKISVKAALEFRLNPQLIKCKERLQKVAPEDLLTIGKNTKETYGEELMILAAKKGHQPAVLHLGIHYYFAEKTKECEAYLKMAADFDSVDAKALWLILQYKQKNYSSAEDILSQLQAVHTKEFEYEKVDKHCREYIEIIKKYIAEKKQREAESESLSSQHILDFMLPNINETSQEPEHGPLATATNCGMPYIDVTGC